MLNANDNKDSIDKKRQDERKLQQDLSQIRPNKEKEKRQFAEDKLKEDAEHSKGSCLGGNSDRLGRVKKRVLLGHWAPLNPGKWLKKRGL